MFHCHLHHPSPLPTYLLRSFCTSHLLFSTPSLIIHPHLLLSYPNLSFSTPISLSTPHLSLSNPHLLFSTPISLSPPSSLVLHPHLLFSTLISRSPPSSLVLHPISSSPSQCPQLFLHMAVPSLSPSSSSTLYSECIHAPFPFFPHA